MCVLSLLYRLHAVIVGEASRSDLWTVFNDAQLADGRAEMTAQGEAALCPEACLETWRHVFLFSFLLELKHVDDDVERVGSRKALLILEELRRLVNVHVFQNDRLVNQLRVFVRVLSDILWQAFEFFRQLKLELV